MRRGEPLRRAPLKSRRKRTGPCPEVVDAVLERASHSCEICGCGLGDRRGIDYQIHHRRPRAMGGTDRADTNLPPNLLLLCPTDHDRIEAHREVAQLAGWLLPQTADPAACDVRIVGPRWVFLTASGHYTDRPPRRD